MNWDELWDLIIFFVLFIGGYFILFRYPVIFVISFILLWIIAGVNLILSDELFYIILGIVCIAIGIQLFRAFLDDTKRTKK